MDKPEKKGDWQELSLEELEAQEAAELPAREAMTLINPSPAPVADGDQLWPSDPLYSKEYPDPPPGNHLPIYDIKPQS